jgi:hypothetical protein
MTATGWSSDELDQARATTLELVPNDRADTP